MKKFKKVFAAVMIGALIMSLGACKSISRDTAASKEESTENADFVSAPSNSKADASITDATSDVPILGTVTDGVYANEYFNVKFTAPADYEFRSQEKLAETSGLTTEYFNDEFLKKNVIGNNANYFDDLGAERLDPRCRVTAVIAGIATDTDSTRQVVSDNLEAALMQYESQGTTVSNTDVKDTVFAGHNVFGYSGQLKTSAGQTAYENRYYLFHGRTVMCITILAEHEAELKDAIAAFEALN